jgi:hypothetical protein
LRGQQAFEDNFCNCWLFGKQPAIWLLEHERVLLDELQDKRKFEGVEVIRVDRTVDPEEGDKKKAEEKARGLLRQTGVENLAKPWIIPPQPFRHAKTENGKPREAETSAYLSKGPKYQKSGPGIFIERTPVHSLWRLRRSDVGSHASMRRPIRCRYPGKAPIDPRKSGIRWVRLRSRIRRRRSRLGKLLAQKRRCSSDNYPRDGNRDWRDFNQPALNV